MNIHRIVPLAVVMPAAVAAAQSSAPAPALARNADPVLETVRAAPDPSLAIEAYAVGVATGRVSAVELKTALVRRMAELGVPEMADAQAHNLIIRGAADATIEGIAAYNDAARGNVHAAVGYLRLALGRRPADPFLLRTAGQVVAWYDAQAESLPLPKEDVAGIEWLRSAGKGRQEFVESYLTVIEARQPSQRRPEAATGGTPTTQRSYVTGGPAPADQGTSRSSYDYQGSGYDYSYANSGYTYQYPYYTSGYVTGSIITLRDRDFQRARRALNDPEFAIGRGGAGDGTAAAALGRGSQPPRPLAQAPDRPPQTAGVLPQSFRPVQTPRPVQPPPPPRLPGPPAGPPHP